MVSENRWKAAQQYERGFWEHQADQIAEGATGQLDWYKWRADQLVANLGRAGLGAVADGSGTVVEVGCGPVGVCSFFPAAHATAVDPLEDYYGRNPVLSQMRNPSVAYRKGVGEQLPVEEGSADLLIIENCIDHVQDVDAVMVEIRRVLAKDAVLYLTVNCRSRWGFVMHRFLSRLKIDAGHPHTFTPRRIRHLIERHGFEIVSLTRGAFLEAWLADLRRPELKGKIKGLLGVSEYVVSILARKRAAA
jgi:SAM-dependent methyltransferase